VGPDHKGNLKRLQTGATRHAAILSSRYRSLLPTGYTVKTLCNSLNATKRARGTIAHANAPDYALATMFKRGTLIIAICGALAGCGGSNHNHEPPQQRRETEAARVQAEGEEDTLKRTTHVMP
jgi:hypothetical protein